MGHQTALFLTRCAVAWSQLGGVATVGFLTFHPKLRALTQCWAARTSHQSRACCSVHMSHLRPGHPFSGQRPQRAQKARPGTSHFFPQPHPGLHAHGSRDRAQPAERPIAPSRSLWHRKGRREGVAAGGGGASGRVALGRQFTPTGAACRLTLNSAASNLQAPFRVTFSFPRLPSKLVPECVCVLLWGLVLL